MSAQPPARLRRRGQRPRPVYLPDFCAARAVLAVVLIAELLALVLALARRPVGGPFWIDLARTSLFLLWIGLLCAAVLCLSRSLARTQSPRRACADVRSR